MTLQTPSSRDNNFKVYFGSTLLFLGMQSDFQSFLPIKTLRDGRVIAGKLELMVPAQLKIDHVLRLLGGKRRSDTG